MLSVLEEPNFRLPELYELIECGQVVPRPYADEEPETVASCSARGVIKLTFGPISYTA